MPGDEAYESRVEPKGGGDGLGRLSPSVKVPRLGHPVVELSDLLQKQQQKTPTSQQKNTYVNTIICCSPEIQFNSLCFIWQPRQWGLRYRRWNSGPTWEELDPGWFTH